jgi:hypothetical protein
VSCSGGSAANPNAEDEYIIRDNEGWQQVNSPAYRKFFVCPGNYINAGTIEVTRSGGADAPRYIVWWTDSAYDADVTAVQMNDDVSNSSTLPWRSGRLGPADVAMVRNIELNGASHIIIDRLVIDVSISNHGVDVANGSTDVILNRILIEADGLPDNDNSSGYGVQFRGNAHRGVLQNSVIRNCSKEVNQDHYGVYIRAHADDVHLVNNEIYNCTQAYQIGDTAATGEGFVVENNDLYWSPDNYMDCGRANGVQKGQKFSDVANPNGSCACGESPGGGHKWGSNNPEAPARIIGNRVWGGREQGWAYHPESDRVRRECGGSGAYPGNLFNVSNFARYLEFGRNIMFDAEMGFKSSGPTDNEVVLDISYHSNLLFDIRDFAEAGHGGDQAARAIWDIRGEKHNYYLNTIVSDVPYLVTDDDNAFDCNVIIGSAKITSTGGGPAEKNVYVKGAEPHPSDANPVEMADSSSNDFGTHCFFRKLQTAPERVCVEQVVPNRGSVLDGVCGTFKPRAAYGLPQ